MHRIVLTPDAIRILRPALSGAIGTVKSEIKNGISELHQSSNGQLLVVTRIEGVQLVVVAVSGSTLYQSRQEIINFARFNQCSSIRFHTKHPERLTRALTGLPFLLVETRKSLLGRNELIYILEL